MDGRREAARRRFFGYLHRHGIARTINSSSGAMGGPVTYLAEGRPWTPRWLMQAALNDSFCTLYPRRAQDHRMTQLVRRRRSAAGSVRWQAEFRGAGEKRRR